MVQVDKHKSDASREVHEMQRRLEQEKTQRTCMMRWGDPLLFLCMISTAFMLPFAA